MTNQSNVVTDQEVVAAVLAALDALRDDEGDIDTDDLPESFELVSEGVFTQEHKYQYAETVIRHVPSDTFYWIDRNRSGSYHSGWYYGKAYVTQVKQKTKAIVVTTWVAVK